MTVRLWFVCAVFIYHMYVKWLYRDKNGSFFGLHSATFCGLRGDRVRQISFDVKKIPSVGRGENAVVERYMRGGITGKKKAQYVNRLKLSTTSPVAVWRMVNEEKTGT